MSQHQQQTIRNKQIDTLKIFNDKQIEEGKVVTVHIIGASVTEIIKNEEYSVGFQAGDQKFKISVQLLANFPNELPKLSINPSVNHQWVVGSTGEIQNAPGLLNFTVHSDLGRVVQAVIREFERYPPQLWSNNITADRTTSPASTPNHRQQQPINISTSSISQLLQQFSIKDLEKIQNDNQFLEDFVEEMDCVQQLTDTLDGLINEVEAISEENLSKRDQVNELNKSINEKNTLFKSLGDKYDQLNRRYQDKTKEFAPQYIKELLQIAVSTSDAECEQNVEHFLNGQYDVQQFLDQYMKTKKCSALRRAKEERLSHQLNALERAAF